MKMSILWVISAGCLLIAGTNGERVWDFESAIKLEDECNRVRNVSEMHSTIKFEEELKEKFNCIVSRGNLTNPDGSLDLESLKSLSSLLLPYFLSIKVNKSIDECGKNQNLSEFFECVLKKNEDYDDIQRQVLLASRECRRSVDTTIKTEIQDEIIFCICSRLNLINPADNSINEEAVINLVISLRPEIDKKKIESVVRKCGSENKKNDVKRNLKNFSICVFVESDSSI